MRIFDGGRIFSRFGDTGPYEIFHQLWKYEETTTTRLQGAPSGRLEFTGKSFASSDLDETQRFLKNLAKSQNSGILGPAYWFNIFVILRHKGPCYRRCCSRRALIIIRNSCFIWCRSSRMIFDQQWNNHRIPQLTTIHDGFPVMRFYSTKSMVIGRCSTWQTLITPENIWLIWYGSSVKTFSKARNELMLP